jgi:hypothetical protein
MNPRIPDDAFQAVADKADELHAVTIGTGSSAEEAGQAVHTYLRSLGLDGEGDTRARALAESALAYASQGTGHVITSNEVHAAVAGIALGLELARETGWEAPLDASGR